MDLGACHIKLHSDLRVALWAADVSVMYASAGFDRFRWRLLKHLKYEEDVVYPRWRFSGVNTLELASEHVLMRDALRWLDEAIRMQDTALFVQRGRRLGLLLSDHGGVEERIEQQV